MAKITKRTITNKPLYEKIKKMDKLISVKKFMEALPKGIEANIKPSGWNWGMWYTLPRENDNYVKPNSKDDWKEFKDYVNNHDIYAVPSEIEWETEELTKVIIDDREFYPMPKIFIHKVYSQDGELLVQESHKDYMGNSKNQTKFAIFEKDMPKIEPVVVKKNKKKSK